jgi:DNA-binding response OmpR family regulator
MTEKKNESAVKGRKRILLVDDEQSILTSFKRFLEKEGYAVSTARGGKQALELLDSGVQFDLAVLDILMPDMTGIDLATEIGKNPKTSSLKIIFLSVVEAGRDMLDMTQTLNIVKWLKKPVDIKVLRNELKAALKKV